MEGWPKMQWYEKVGDGWVPMLDLIDWLDVGVRAAPTALDRVLGLPAGQCSWTARDFAYTDGAGGIYRYKLVMPEDVLRIAAENAHG